MAANRLNDTLFEKTGAVACEIRQTDTGLAVAGPVIRYNERARIGDQFTESFAPGSVLLAARVVANRQHDRARALAAWPSGKLEVRHQPPEGGDFGGIYVVIPLPDTSEGRDVRILVQEGVLNGLSGEFVVREQVWANETDRRITSAVLHGVGIVDRAAYAGAVASLLQTRAYHAGLARRSTFLQRLAI